VLTKNQEKKMRKVLVIFALFCAFFKMFAEDDEKLRLAVMEFEDRSGKIKKKTLSEATEYVRASIISSNTYIVISKERQEQEMIKEMKKESYKSCNDKNCQIPLGQALSADTILRTTITFFGGTYTITSELIDLEKEATIIGAKKNYNGTEKSMREAVDYIVEQVISTYKHETSKESLKNQTINITKLKDDGKMWRDVGISVLVVGSSLGAVIAGVSPCAYDEYAYDKYHQQTHSSRALLSIGIIMIAGSIGGGTYLLIKGLKMQKEAEYLELNNVSVLPTNDGFYASVGFSF